MRFVDRLLPWRRYLRELKQSQVEADNAIKETKNIHNYMCEKVVREERSRIAKTMLAARRAAKIAHGVAADE